MPYGLSVATSVFQNLINDVLWDTLRHFIIGYIDDMLIYSPNLETHINNAKVVLKHLLKHQHQGVSFMYPESSSLAML